MQHGRASSSLATRGVFGRSRLMSLLMALCLFAAVALAIPGFVARAAVNEEPYPIPNTAFVAALQNGSGFEEAYGKTGYWGIMLDHGQVTPVDAPSFEREGERVSVADARLWKVANLQNYSMLVPVPNGTNNAQGVTWEPGSVHTVTVLMYRADGDVDDAETIHYSVRVYRPNNAGEEPVDPPVAEPGEDASPTPDTEPNATPTTEPSVEPSREPSPLADAPQLPVTRPSASPSATPQPTPSPSETDNTSEPSDSPISPISDVSQLNDANKGGVSAAFASGQLKINVPSDKASAGEWVSANIMQTGEARWLQVADSNQVIMDVTGLTTGEYKVVVANRAHELVGWAEFKVASAVGAAPSSASVDASGSVKLHADMLSSSLAGDESEGLNGYLLGAGACMLILGALVVVQVLSGPKVRSSSHGVTLS